MKTVTIYTDGKDRCAALQCPHSLAAARQPRGDDRQAPSRREAV